MKKNITTIMVKFLGNPLALITLWSLFYTSLMIIFYWLSRINDQKHIPESGFVLLITAVILFCFCITLLVLYYFLAKKNKKKGKGK